MRADAAGLPRRPEVVVVSGTGQGRVVVAEGQVDGHVEVAGHEVVEHRHVVVALEADVVAEAHKQWVDERRGCQVVALHLARRPGPVDEPVEMKVAVGHQAEGVGVGGTNAHGLRLGGSVTLPRRIGVADAEVVHFGRRVLRDAHSQAPAGLRAVPHGLRAVVGRGDGELACEVLRRQRGRPVARLPRRATLDGEGSTWYTGEGRARAWQHDEAIVGVAAEMEAQGGGLRWVKGAPLGEEAGPRDLQLQRPGRQAGQLEVAPARVRPRDADEAAVAAGADSGPSEFALALPPGHVIDVARHRPTDGRRGRLGGDQTRGDEEEGCPSSHAPILSAGAYLSSESRRERRRRFPRRPWRQ